MGNVVLKMKKERYHAVILRGMEPLLLISIRISFMIKQYNKYAGKLGDVVDYRDKLFLNFTIPLEYFRNGRGAYSKLTGCFCQSEAIFFHEFQNKFSPDFREIISATATF